MGRNIILLGWGSKFKLLIRYNIKMAMSGWIYAHLRDGIGIEGDEIWGGGLAWGTTK